MNARILCPAALGLCLTVLALSAGGQTANGKMPQAMGNATAGATMSAGSGMSTMSPGTKREHRAVARHRSHPKHENMAAGSAGKGREAAYRAALKHCVAGPASQREGCLDSAIARFGRT